MDLGTDMPLVQKLIVPCLRYVCTGFTVSTPSFMAKCSFIQTYELIFNGSNKKVNVNEKWYTNFSCTKCFCIVEAL